MHEWILVIVGLPLVGGAAWLLALVALESRRCRVVCLMYHRLVSREAYERQRGTEETVFSLPADAFEEQIVHLKQAGYTFLTPDDVRRVALGERVVDGPAVLLTFDDGCVSVDRVARPVLEKHGARGTVFVTTDPRAYVFGRGDGDERRLTDEELRGLDGDTVNVESHGVT
ncbi:MAG: polysaccharide deacetylase family protein, partial [Phycisphaerae bacterium]|nr:polysaccharide deacetylase family protein [Phycisphaerae bacterium]